MGENDNATADTITPRFDNIPEEDLITIVVTVEGWQHLPEGTWAIDITAALLREANAAMAARIVELEAALRQQQAPPSVRTG